MSNETREVALFDPARVFNDYVRGRRVAYLDHNVWIDLRDARTAEAADCRDACKTAVARGLVAFPLSFALIGETAEIPDESDRLATADLLDEFSLGLTFRSSTMVMGCEAISAAAMLLGLEVAAVAPEQVLSRVPDHLGDSRLTLPVEWSAERVSEFQQALATQTPMTTARYCVVVASRQKERSPDWRTPYVSGMKGCLDRQAARARCGDKTQAFRRMLREEQYVQFKSLVLPLLRTRLDGSVSEECALTAIQAFIARESDHRKWLAAMFKIMPVTSRFAHICARHAWEGRRNAQPQDFFDFEHALLPPLYAHVVVTRDNRLADLIDSIGGNSSQVLRRLSDLHRWIER